MNDYIKYIDQDSAFNEIVTVLKKGLGRELSDLELRKIRWFADCEYETVGVFVDLFKELSKEGV